MRNFITLVSILVVINNFNEISSASSSPPRTRDFITNFGRSGQHSDNRDAAVSGNHLQLPFVHQFMIYLPCDILISMKGHRRPFWQGSLNPGIIPSWMLNQNDPYDSEDNVYVAVPYGNTLYRFTGKTHNLDMAAHSHPVAKSKVVLKCANGNFISLLGPSFREIPQDAFASLHVRLPDGILHGGLDAMSQDRSNK